MAKKKATLKRKYKSAARRKSKPVTFRRDKTKSLQEKFLAVFNATANVSTACEQSGITRQAHYRWMHEDAEYREKFDEAFKSVASILEEEAVRRAVQGTRRDVFYQGAKCGEELVYSDTLLIFLLKGMKPSTYRERHDITVGKNDNELNRELASALAELAARSQGSDATGDPAAVGEQTNGLLPAPTIPEAAIVSAS